MNAARPVFSGAFGSASLSPNPAVPAPHSLAPAGSSTSRLPVRARAAAKAAAKARRTQNSEQNAASDSASCDEYSSCMVQARICRDQAQEAARLKRFQAAVGLFQTAISLCQRAVSLYKSPPLILASAGAEPCISNNEAHEYLQVLASEMSAYDELARSMNRPLLEAGR